jgi:glutamine---fructose-6-phosphate transaminase (isomerizing)
MKPVSETGFLGAAGSSMTHFLRDILRQPAELQRTIDFLRGKGRRPLQEAASAVRNASHVYLTGIGSSWHAALTAGPAFSLGGRPVFMQDAAELLQFATFPPDAVLIVISRSGRSIEIVNLLAKARESGARVIGVTNLEAGALAREAQIPLVISTRLDHGISVNTYTTLAATAGALAAATVGSFDDRLADSLSRTLSATERALAGWQRQSADTAWLAAGGVYYFLARGPGLGSCHEARLMWEEGVKSPATAMGTGSFRHGPQEMVRKEMRFGIWIDGKHMREQDLAVARDLTRLGASVMSIGQHLPAEAGALVFHLPEVPEGWQFLIDIIPAQLAAEALSRLSGVDCDSFSLCPYIVEDEYGLLREEVAAPKPEE